MYWLDFYYYYGTCSLEEDILELQQQYKVQSKKIILLQM